LNVGSKNLEVSFKRGLEDDIQENESLEEKNNFPHSSNE